ncbi:hypothetical protein K7X08_028141 [Anisodus acutangulus]|uniref:Uncharacterized protein n=1 Tax=Anisodus acutangulus TaxID=402998 RepID=A0A9Q1MXX0_9SOLA|nr:hypothetical protein K7X08_028141 [Anisodus acutangulus]
MYWCDNIFLTDGENIVEEAEEEKLVKKLQVKKNKDEEHYELHIIQQPKRKNTWQLDMRLLLGNLCIGGHCHDCNECFYS